MAGGAGDNVHGLQRNLAVGLDVVVGSVDDQIEEQDGGMEHQAGDGGGVVVAWASSGLFSSSRHRAPHDATHSDAAVS